MLEYSPKSQLSSIKMLSSFISNLRIYDKSGCLTRQQMDPGLSTSPNQFPDLGLSIVGKGFSVKRFIGFPPNTSMAGLLFTVFRHFFRFLYT